MARKAPTQKGFALYYSVPQLDVTYAQLEQIAMDAGLSVAYTPDPPEARAAWQKATNLGANGRKLQIPDAEAIALTKDHKGGWPEARLFTVEINRGAPVLKRHLVLRVVVPRADAPDVALWQETVAVITIDVGSNPARASAMRVGSCPSWADQVVSDVVQELHDKMIGLTHKPAPEHIRAGVRECLDDLHRVALRKGVSPVYYVPHQRAGARDILAALIKYIRALDSYVVNRNKHDAGINCWAVYDDEDAFEFGSIADLEARVVDSFKGQLEALHLKSRSIISGRSKGKVAEQVRDQILEELTKLNAGLKAYRASLDSELTMVDDMYTLAKGSVLRAVDLVASGQAAAGSQADENKGKGK